MQSSDPSGKSVTCVPIPDTSALQQQITNEAAARQAMDANILNMLGAEAAARQAGDGALGGRIDAEMGARQGADAALGASINAEIANRQAADNALGARIDALNEPDIVGRWAATGTTSCLQSNRGFDANFSPVVISGQPTIVSQLNATSLGTRTFNADGTGTAVATTQAFTGAGTVVGVLGTDGTGGATVTTLDEVFTWQIQPDGTLLINNPAVLPQPFIAPPSRVGWTATIENLPPFVGYISKDRKTIVITHPGMQMETSVTRDNNNNVISTNPRFCARHRVLTRLPD